MPRRVNKTKDHASMEFAVMAVGAHADDLELQMGGTLAKYHYGYGYDVIYIMTTNNMSSNGQIHPGMEHTEGMTARSIRIRQSEANAAAEYYGTQAIHLNHAQRHYWTNDGKKVKLDYGAPPFPGHNPEIPCILTAHEHGPSVQRLVDLILSHNPEAIFTHGGPMLNLEHVATQFLVTKAYWAAVKSGYQGHLLFWHDLGVNYFSDYRQKWDTFINISDYFQSKLDAARIHLTMKPYPEKLDWPQWGAACNCRHAEIFDIVGWVKDTVQQGALTLELMQNRR